MTNYLDPVTNRETRASLLFFRRNFIISPKQWATIDSKHLSFIWKEIKFTELNRNSLPEVEGVYFFTASPKRTNAHFINYLFYIGETGNLKQRYSNYLDKVDNPKSGQYKVYTIIDDFPNDLYFHYVELPGHDMAMRRVIENELLIGYVPPINSKYPQGLQSIISATYDQ